MRATVAARRGVLALGTLIGAALLASPVSAAPPDVDALVTYETQQRLSNGVTRTERWQERLVRSGDAVWTERVRVDRGGVAHADESAAEHVGHKHFDFDVAARWLQREPNGAVRLRYVDRAERVVVAVPAAEFGAVGFDGRWDTAAHVAPPAAIARMPAIGAGVRQERANGWTHRVRWSDAWQLPLRLESQRDDGSVRRVVTVTPSVPAAAAPWNAIDARYVQKEYDDFLD